MTHSMTGYGSSAKHYGGFVIQIEIKSVNHRYAEVVLRMPREWTCYEDGLRRLVQRHVKRGRIDVYISRERDSENSSPYVLNSSVVEAYLHAAEELGAKYGANTQLSAKDLLALPDVLSVPDPSSDSSDTGEEWENVLSEGVDEALAGLLRMREQEGLHLIADLENRLSNLEGIHAELLELAPEVVKDYRNRLKGRLAELLEGTTLDEHRFAMEVALFADRSNIDEELIRLKSHFEQCRGLLQSREPVGRKLDFLIQEMNRETNTIGSKANHLALVNRVVEMKAELEKIREQAANIE